MKHVIVSLTLTLGIYLAGAHGQLIATNEQPPSPAKLAAKGIVDSINAEIAHRVKVHQSSFADLWHNPRPGCSPAEVLAEMGTNARLVFQFASENLDHIDRCAQLVGKTRADFIPDAECIPPLAFTVHQDGTVTINP